MTSYSHRRLAECAERELKYRERVYARRIARGDMTPILANEEIAMMRAIRDHFDKLASEAEPSLFVVVKDGPPRR